MAKVTAIYDVVVYMSVTFEGQSDELPNDDEVSDDLRDSLKEWAENEEAYLVEINSVSVE